MPAEPAARCGARGRGLASKVSKKALITGASRGLGLALAATAWRRRGSSLVIDAATPDRVDAAADRDRAADGRAPRSSRYRATSPTPRTGPRCRAADRPALDLLVNNAGILGPAPLPAARRLSARRAARRVRGERRRAARADPAAPCRRCATRRGAVVNVTSDAAVEAYAGWGGYGAAKAALEQASRTCSPPRSPDVRVWWVDPGDLRTRDAPGRRSRARTSATGRCRTRWCPPSADCSPSAPPSGRSLADLLSWGRR